MVNYKRRCGLKQLLYLKKSHSHFLKTDISDKSELAQPILWKDDDSSSQQFTLLLERKPCCSDKCPLVWKSIWVLHLWFVHWPYVKLQFLLNVALRLNSKNQHGHVTKKGNQEWSAAAGSQLLVFFWYSEGKGDLLC